MLTDHDTHEVVPVSGLGRRSSVSGRPLEGWRVASKGLGPLPRRRGRDLAPGCGKAGRVVLPLGEAVAGRGGRRVNRPGAHPADADAQVLEERGEGTLQEAVFRGRGRGRVRPPPHVASTDNSP